jgi:hypothetical protein
LIQDRTIPHASSRLEKYFWSIENFFDNLYLTEQKPETIVMLKADRILLTMFWWKSIFGVIEHFFQE